MILVASVPLVYLTAVLMSWAGRLVWRRSNDQDGLSKWERVAPFARALAITFGGIALSGILFAIDHDGVEWLAPSLLATAWAAQRLRKLLVDLSSVPNTWNAIVIGLVIGQLAIVILLLPLFTEQLR